MHAVATSHDANVSRTLAGCALEHTPDNILQVKSMLIAKYARVNKVRASKVKALRNAHARGLAPPPFASR